MTPSKARKPTPRGVASNTRKTHGVKSRKWSGEVGRKSDALDLQAGLFKSTSARRIALSLKRSADSSRRRKTTPFRSAMSMLNFEINRAGRTLSKSRREVLERAKTELRSAYGRTSGSH